MVTTAIAAQSMETYRVDLNTVELMVERLLKKMDNYQSVHRQPGQAIEFQATADRDEVVEDLFDSFKAGLGLAVERPARPPSRRRFLR